MMNSKKAFNYEEGQFICHIYVDVAQSSSESGETLEDIVKCIQNTQNSCKEDNLWQPMSNLNKSFIALTNNHSQYQNPSFHITLVRGHRSLCYHQIRPLVEDITERCKNHKPFTLCLDRLVIFDNQEKTKSFLCLSSHQSNGNLDSLKKSLHDSICLFATLLSDEDETDDTIAHCSLMWRHLDVMKDKQTSYDEEIIRLNNIISKPLNDFLIEIIIINAITVRIGHQEYSIPLGE